MPLSHQGTKKILSVFVTYSNKSRGLRKKQGDLKPDDQPLDEAIEIIDVSEYNRQLYY